MWPTGGGYHPGWPQGAAPANNPTPQQSEPSEWAAKAAHWAQQKTIQEQTYQQQMAALMAQQQQAAAAYQQPTQTYQQPTTPAQTYQQSTTLAQAYQQPTTPAQTYQQPTTLAQAYQPTTPAQTYQQASVQPPTPVQSFQQPPTQATHPTQATPSVQATPPVQRSQPKPLFSSPAQQPPQAPSKVTPARAVESGGLGPGNIESPPNNDPPSRFVNPDFHRGGGGFRGRGGRPPQRDFQPRDRRGGDFRFRGPQRGGVRPRMPHPPRERGPSPRQWHQGYPPDQFDRPRPPGTFDRRQPEEKFDERPAPKVREDFVRKQPEEDKKDFLNRAHWPEKDERKNEDLARFEKKDSSSFDQPPERPPMTFEPQGFGPQPPKEKKVVLKSRVEQEDEDLYASSPKPTISSLRKQGDPQQSIPGLGELDSQPQEDSPQPQTETPKSEQATTMLASLGKLMTELQGLKGLTSSLQLLQALPRSGSEPPQKDMTEKEISDDSRKTAAALLANESDSEGEAQPLPKEPYRNPPRAAQPVSHYSNEEQPDRSAREFDGYNVKPLVYGTYTNQDSYPVDERRARDDYRGEQDYPPEYPRNDSYDRRDYDYPSKREGPPQSSDGYYPPSQDRYDASNRDYPPPSEPYPERGDGNWGESHDYNTRSYQDEYPPPREDRYPPIEHPPQDYRRPRDEYSYGGQPVPPNREREDNYRDPVPPERPFTATPIESFDYGHGGAPAIVDYNHGKGGVVDEAPPPFTDRQIPEPPQTYKGQSSEGYSQYPPAGESTQFSSSYPGYPNMASFGSSFPPGMSYFPSGVDPAQAALIAAYTAQAGETKKKVLPGWLRDELEKMEAKRQKELEKEKEATQARSGEGEGRPTWRDEIDLEEEEATRKEEKKEGGRSKRSYRQKSSSPQRGSSGGRSPPVKRKKKEPLPVEDEEEKEVSKIMKIRRLLTEILLDVTNQEIEAVASEVIEEEKKPKLAFEFKNQNFQAGGGNVLAGLSMYDSESDSDHDDKKKRYKDGKSSNPLLDPKTIAKAFSDSSSPGLGLVDPSLPPPSKEQQEWADRLLSDLTPHLRKDSSRSKRRRSSSNDRRSRKDSDRRSSQEEHSRKSSKSSSHKKSGSNNSSKNKELSSKSHSKSSPGKHSPPPPSGMSFTSVKTTNAKKGKWVEATPRVEIKSLGNPLGKSPSSSGRSHSPHRGRKQRSKSRSVSPVIGRKVSYRKGSSQGKSPTWSGQKNQGSGKRGRSRSKSPPWGGQRLPPPTNYRIVTRK